MASKGNWCRAAALNLLLVCALYAVAFAQGQVAAPAKSGVERSVFGKLDDGTEIELFTLRNTKGAIAKVTTYGAVLTELWMPDRAGKLTDVVLGFDNLQGYLGNHPHFGGTIGRYANRIAGGKFELDGKEYSLAVNNGPNTLHGGKISFDRRVWKAEPVTAGEGGAAIRFTYTSPDGEENFPGNLSVSVGYTLTNDNALEIDYSAKTDKATPINLTNHSYFNLSGSGDVLGYTVYINSDHYTPVDSTLIPTGEIVSVKGTPYDFTHPATVSSRMSEIKNVAGYDINYVVNGTSGRLRLAAKVDDPSSGREMEVWTTQPGVQFYNAIGLNGTLTGVGGVTYKKYGAVCLETQHYPDSVHHANFPSVILRPGKTFHEATVYKFLAK
jgi:aldose 1-epimerase